MDDKKLKRLEEMGGRVTTTVEFLGLDDFRCPRRKGTYVESHCPSPLDRLDVIGIAASLDVSSKTILRAIAAGCDTPQLISDWIKNR